MVDSDFALEQTPLSRKSKRSQNLQKFVEHSKANLMSNSGLLPMRKCKNIIQTPKSNDERYASSKSEHDLVSSVDINTLARLFHSNTPEGIVVWVGSRGTSDRVGPVENRTLYSALIGVDDYTIFIE